MGATNAFVGRASELERIAVALGESRLVTLLGPGGVGKTRLASEVLTTRAGVFCDLSEARDVAAMCVAVARAFDLPLLRDEEENVEQLGRALAAHVGDLVVLDNFEQLPQSAAEAVAIWLDRAPSLRLLVTSRERLQIAGEHVVVLEPLPPQDATALFTARARAAGADVGAADDEVIADVVELLDRVPLAIELAAARARLLTPQELLARLREGLSALGTGPRDVSPRQRTIAASIAWSWDLLEPDEREGLSQCAMFRGSFSATAATAVIEAPDSLDLLQRLCDKSLVHVVATPVGRNAFRLLNAVRAHALERMPPSEAARSRYWRYVASVAEGWLADIDRRVFDADPKTLHDALRAQEALLSAIGFARASTEDDAYDAVATIVTAFVSIVARAGPLAPHLPMLDAILADERVAALESTQQVRLSLCRAQVRRLCGELDGALADATQAIALCEDPRMQARARWVKGLVHAGRGELETASKVLGIALDAVQLHDVPAAVGALLVDMAEVAQRRDDHATAAARIDRALPILRVAGARRDVGRALDLRGLLEDGDAATTALSEALVVFREIGDRRREAASSRHLAVALQRQGRFEEAGAELTVAEAKLAELGDHSGQMRLIALRGLVEHEAGDVHAALELHRLAAAGFIQIGDHEAARVAVSRAAAALADLGDVDAAEGGVLLEVHRAHVDLARGDAESARRRRAEETAASPMDLALFDSLLTPEDALGVGPEAAWLVLPGGERVDLSKKEALRRIAFGLASARRRRPGQPLLRADLFALGWPDEKALLKAQGTRVRVALSTLRKAGLRELLLSKDDGWLLDPAVRVYSSR